jgi:hypothetical protein
MIGSRPQDAKRSTCTHSIFKRGEILSPSTASIEIGVKNEEYRDTPSIQRYIMLAQDRQFATMFARAGDDWVGHIVSGGAVLGMPEIGIEVPMAELYEGVSFAQPGEPVGSDTQ